MRKLLTAVCLLVAVGSHAASQQKPLQASWIENNHLIAAADDMTTLASRLIASQSVVAWRGERLGLEAVVQTDATSEPLTLRLKAKGKTSRQWEAKADFLGWVLTDSFNTCGNHPDDLEPYLVPDIIGGGEQPKECKLRPVWCTIEVPYNCKAGRYEWQLEVVGSESKRTLARLPLRVEVVGCTLPRPQEQQFHLDYWQQPYSVSRFYNVPRWSQQHYDLLRPYLQMLARAGQKVVTTVLFIDRIKELLSPQETDYIKGSYRWETHERSYEKRVSYHKRQYIDKETTYEICQLLNEGLGFTLYCPCVFVNPTTINTAEQTMGGRFTKIFYPHYLPSPTCCVTGIDSKVMSKRNLDDFMLIPHSVKEKNMCTFKSEERRLLRSQYEDDE